MRDRTQRARWTIVIPCLFLLLGLPVFPVLPVHADASRYRPASQGDVTAEAVQAALPRLEELAETVIADGGVPGMAIAVVYQDEVVYLEGFGVREVGKDDPVTADTVFQLASMSKPLASTVVSIAVTDGLVAWDDHVIDHDPSFQLADSWVTRQVTLRDLFSHRSGLPGEAGNDLEQVGYARDEILERLRYIKPASSLRSAYAYSNFGLTEAGVATARAAGQSWEELSETALYAPLGMASTSSRHADFLAADERAALHAPVDGQWAAAYTRQPDAQAPAGGVSSTVRDLAQWMRLQLNGGEIDGQRLIAADVLAETHTPQIVTHADPITGAPSYYGLGWNVRYGEDGHIFVTHAGAFSQGARTFVSLLPDEELGIVVLTNAFPTGVPDGIADSFFDLVLHDDLTRDWIGTWSDLYQTLSDSFAAAAAAYATPPDAPSPPLPDEAYLGRYENAYFGEIDIAHNGDELVLQIGPSGQRYPLQHWSRDLFLIEAAPELPGVMSAVTFQIGPEQIATELVLDAFDDDGQGRFLRMGEADE